MHNRELRTAEKNLLAALRTAPTAAVAIAGELEKVAQERQELERTISAEGAGKGDTNSLSVSEEGIKAFAAAVGGRLGTMDVGQRQQVLSVVGFQATVTKTGEVKASILVPAKVNPNHHCTNMGMTPSWHITPTSSAFRSTCRRRRRGQPAHAPAKRPMR